MKKLIFAVFTLAVSVTMYAQNAEQEEIDYIQSVYGMEKKMIVAEFLQLDETSAAAFWPVYDAYETQRKELGKQRLELLKFFDTNTDDMTDESADEWMKDVIKLGANTDKLLKSYYGKVKKATNSITGAKFYQIESYLLTAQRFAIQDALPVVGGQLN